MTAVDKPKAQADKIAATLKAVERGETVANDPAGKIAAARATGEITFAVIMDDKIIKVTMPWAIIRDSDEAGISEWILAHMREPKTKPH